MKLIQNLSVVPMENYLIKSRKWDFFVTCGSFEERCIRSSDILLSKNISIYTSIIFNFKENDIGGKKDKHIKTMVRKLKRICENVLVFNAESVSSPSEGIKKFLLFLTEKNIDMLNKQVIFDISVFTKGYFFLLIKVLKERMHIDALHFAYTEPEKYRSKNLDKNQIILTEGLDRIESLPGFTGSSIHTKDALIVILGFEGKRSLEVFNTVNPELTYAINGFPSFKPQWHKISLEANLLFLRESGASTHLFYAPAVDPFETYKTLSNIIMDIQHINNDMNVIIAPLGTKPQALGSLLYALAHPRTTIIYPFPSVYNTDYSYKYGPTWILKVGFDKLIGAV